VDDEALNRAVLGELLWLVGFEAIEADSPAEALSLLGDHFDAVISDIRMPVFDGHAFCRKLRSSPETNDLIVIASSANISAEEQQLARRSGFSDFLETNPGRRAIPDSWESFAIKMASSSTRYSICRAFQRRSVSCSRDRNGSN
jgi:CheY-like chemotaxis protein